MLQDLFSLNGFSEGATPTKSASSLVWSKQYWVSSAAVLLTGILSIAASCLSCSTCLRSAANCCAILSIWSETSLLFASNAWPGVLFAKSTFDLDTVEDLDQMTFTQLRAPTIENVLKNDYEFVKKYGVENGWGEQMYACVCACVRVFRHVASKIHSLKSRATWEAPLLVEFLLVLRRDWSNSMPPEVQAPLRSCGGKGMMILNACICYCFPLILPVRWRVHVRFPP